MNTQTGLVPPPQTWRRVTRHPALMEYRRLAALVLVVNAAIFAGGLSQGLWWKGDAFDLGAISDIAVANLTLAILIRQQRMVNALFWIATRLPVSAPLWLRRRAAKVFHFGGLHSGAAGAGTAWFGVLLVATVLNSLHAEPPGNLTLGLTAAMLGLMSLMIVTALGPIRAQFHDRFELVHRFGGWTLLALFWAHATAISRDAGGALTETWSFWALCLVTLSTASPWLTLKRVKIEVRRPSSHAAIVRFDYGETPFPGSSNAISVNPLREWHSFANIPAPGESGYRLAIPRAGDWTGRFIDSPPSHVWVKGVTTSGVARIETLFRRVIYVGTGSGIGPILPHLLGGNVPCRLIWSTRSPRRTYGDALVDEIESHSIDPLIWDTDANGKPDLSALAWHAAREFGAEAVIVISNQKLTRKIVHDMESRGLPAYGAIWDS